jgi:lysophospholipase L1-like esterase
MIQYLALGDSYTIGEQVNTNENFPNCFANLYHDIKGEEINTKIIAKTGWTSDELMLALSEIFPHTLQYDIVSLLIGVNNQYRGRSVENYRAEFYALLCQSILFANNNRKNVVVFSIPDWGLTPFNKEKDAKEVSKEIDAFNAENFSICNKMNCHYIDITPLTRQYATNTEFLTPDLLHYSQNMYHLWAEKMLQKFL